MKYTARLLAIVSLTLTSVVGASAARAQASKLTVRSSRTDTVSIAPGGVFTAPFAIVNPTSDSLAMTAAIELPKGWTTVNSTAPANVAANGMELWLISVSAPSAAPAGRYVLKAGVRDGAMDSLVVEIAERRELEVRSLNPQSYVLTGNSYEAKFIVRNRGNVASHVAISATSNRGTTPKLSASQFELAAGASATLSATVAIPTTIEKSTTELLEVIAVDGAVDTVRADASLETTVIPNGNNTPEFWTVPGSVSFRAGAGAAGVSPIVASGSGRLFQNSDLAVDFSLRGKTGSSSLFGEREEYRLGLHNSHGGVRVGDDSYGFSLLTSTGGQGTGAEVRANGENLTGGVYVQHNRFVANAPTEVAAMIGTPTEGTTTASLVALERGNAGSISRVLAGTAQREIGRARLELEAAGSDSMHQNGGAAIARFYGDASSFSYDVGTQLASNTFAGSQRASSDQHATISGQRLGMLTLSAMTSIHTMNPTVQSLGFGQKIATTSVSGTFDNGSAIELERFDRADQGSTAGVRGHQNSIRLRSHYALGGVDLQGTAQQGVVSQADSAGARGYTDLSLSARTLFARDQYLSLFTEYSNGKSLGSSGIGTITAGGNTELHLGDFTTVRLSATLTAQQNSMSAWSGQGDLSVERAIRQSIVALRARTSQYGADASRSQNGLFLEIRTPLHLPTSRLNVGGRAHAQVVDAETGKGVEGALVRLGEHAAITDKNGNANFRGLEAGEYHAAVEGGIAAGQVVAGGNAINVAETGREPVQFTLSVARGAHVVALLRSYEKSVNAKPDATDSLADAGAAAVGSMVALISSRDTLWQSSDDRGRIDFGSIAPGHYTMSVVGSDVPEFMAYEKKQIEIDVAAGDQREVNFRLVPQTRAVEFVGAETVLVAAPVVAPTQSAPRQAGAGRRQNQNQNNNNN